MGVKESRDALLSLERGGAVPDDLHPWESRYGPINLERGGAAPDDLHPNLGGTVPGHSVCSVDIKSGGPHAA